MSRIAWSIRASDSWNWTTNVTSPAVTSPASIMPSMAATTRKRTEWIFAPQPEGSIVPSAGEAEAWPAWACQSWPCPAWRFPPGCSSEVVTMFPFR